MRVGYTSEFLACSAPYSCSRFVLSSPLVASPFHIYNVYLSGVLGHLPCYPDSAVFFKGFESAAGMRVRGKHMTMSDPLAKIKRKLQEEIDQLPHELKIEILKKYALARTDGEQLEVVTPAGKKEFEIVELVTIHDGE